MSDNDEICSHCGTFEHLHVDGACPKVVSGLADPPNLDLPLADKYANGIPGMVGKRGPGRPKGSKSWDPDRTQVRLDGHNQKVMARALVKEASEKLAGAFEPRITKRPNVPKRSISEAKQAAFDLLNQQLWNLEGIADTIGLTESEEQRTMKIMAALNAALPKSAEEAPEKPLSEMTDEELAEYERKRKR